MNTQAEILQVTKENALQAHKGADAGGRGLLENLFGKRLFLTKIIDRIASFEDCCAEVGEDPKDVKFHQGEPDEIAYRKLKIITRAYNEGWVPNWNDDTERKWWAWWYMDKPGFRLGGIGYCWTFATTSSGSRLCFKSQELAKHAADLFIDIYKAFITTPNDAN